MLVGGLRQGRFFGQGGNDRIWARDAFRELVAGGLGFDRARVNAVRRPPLDRTSLLERPAGDSVEWRRGAAGTPLIPSCRLRA